MKKLIIVLIVILVLGGLVMAARWQSRPTAGFTRLSGYEDVTICGVSYQAEKVLASGVDFAGKISKLAKSGSNTCSHLQTDSQTGAKLAINFTPVTYQTEPVFSVSLGSTLFLVNLKTGKIFESGSEEETLLGNL